MTSGFRLGSFVGFRASSYATCRASYLARSASFLTAGMRRPNESTHGRQLTDVQAHDLIVRALDNRAITITQVPAILKEWRVPRHPEFAGSLVSSHANGETFENQNEAGLATARNSSLRRNTGEFASNRIFGRPSFD